MAAAALAWYVAAGGTNDQDGDARAARPWAGVAGGRPDARQPWFVRADGQTDRMRSDPSTVLACRFAGDRALGRRLDARDLGLRRDAPEAAEGDVPLGE